MGEESRRQIVNRARNNANEQRGEEEAHHANRQHLVLPLVKLLLLLASSPLPGYRSDRLLPCHRPLSRTLASSSSRPTPRPTSRPDRRPLRPDQLSHSKT